MKKMSICNNVEVYFGEGVFKASGKDTHVEIIYMEDVKKIVLKDHLKPVEKEISPYYFDQVIQMISGDFEGSDLLELLERIPSTDKIIM